MYSPDSGSPAAASALLTIASAAEFTTAACPHTREITIGRESDNESSSSRVGNRPSFIRAAKTDQAKSLWEDFNHLLRKQGLDVQTGIFAADMKVELFNDGPVTLILDSKENA